VLSNLDQMPGIQVFMPSSMSCCRTGPGWTLCLWSGHGFVRCHGEYPGSAELQKWVRAGYLAMAFPVLAMNSWKLFADGEGLMMLTGSWLSAELVKAGGEDSAFFCCPHWSKQVYHWPSEGGRTVCIRNGTRTPSWQRLSRLDDLAPRGRLWLERGLLPAVPVHLSKLPQVPYGDIVSAYDVLSIADGLGHYIDWASPDMYNVLGAATRI